MTSPITNPHYPLHGHSALITGGGSGIGLGSALALLRAGCTITIAGRSLSRLQSARDSLLTSVPLLDPKPVIFIESCDVTIESEVASLVKKAYENGGEKLNVVVMSAGGGDPKGKPLQMLANTEVESFEVSVLLE